MLRGGGKGIEDDGGDKDDESTSSGSTVVGITRLLPFGVDDFAFDAFFAERKAFLIVGEIFFSRFFGFPTFAPSVAVVFGRFAPTLGFFAGLLSC